MQTKENSRTEWSGGDPSPANMGRITAVSRFLKWATMAYGEVSYSTDSLSKWLRYTTNAAIVIGLGYLCARFTWLVVAGVTLPVSEQTAYSPASSFAGSRASESYEIFATFDPFFRRTASTEKTNVVAVPETNLDLKLFGLRAGTENNRGSAIIRTPDKRQASYAVGDEVTAGVVLKQVLANRAIISRNGVQESLSLNPERGDGAHVMLSSVGASAALGSMSVSPIATAALPSLLRQLNLKPRLQNGSINGFYVDVDGTNPELLNSVGLLPADILLSVNDVRLVSLERITDVLEELANTVSFDAVIERDGSLKTLTLERPAGQR